MELKAPSPSIVVCDMWNELVPNDVNYYSYLQKDTHAFGTFLNTVLNWERHHGATIYHCANGRQIMESIDVNHKDVVLDRLADISLDHNRYIFVGLHKNRCVDGYARELIDLGVEPHRLECWINCIMTYPHTTFHNDYPTFKMGFWTHGNVTWLDGVAYV